MNAVQYRKAVSAYYTNKQILLYGFVLSSIILGIFSSLFLLSGLLWLYGAKYDF